MILRHFPPMGVYETLFAFADATGSYMGDPGTHPWAQGFPLTEQLPGGPPLPTQVQLDPGDFRYPKATGNDELRSAIAEYYNHFYGTQLDPDNVAVFAGGRPAIVATLAFLREEFVVLLAATEYTPYYDMMRLFDRPHRLIRSNADNEFRPTMDDLREAADRAGSNTFLVASNPCNPTGVAVTGEDLRALVNFCREPGRGGLFDEAYEFFCDPAPDSALRYIDDIDETDIFVVGAATKGLQVPGLRVGWAIASRRHIELFRNYSSIGMGGVSRASQRVVTGLLEIERVTLARQAVQSFFGAQRQRYGKALADLGFELFTGDGGFYHWARLPHGLDAEQFNRRLYEHRAAILPGPLCDMARERGGGSSLEHFVRFSFGPLAPESFEDDVEILARCV